MWELQDYEMKKNTKVNVKQFAIILAYSIIPEDLERMAVTPSDVNIFQAHHMQRIYARDSFVTPPVKHFDIDQIVKKYIWVDVRGYQKYFYYLDGSLHHVI